jgi:hypothetical protein
MRIDIFAPILRPFCANGDQRTGQEIAYGALSGETKIAFVIRVRPGHLAGRIAHCDAKPVRMKL